MSVEYSRAALKVVVAQLCSQLGWNSIHSTPLEVMVDILERYLLQLGNVTHAYAEQRLHNEPNLADVVMAFRDANVHLPDLADYLHHLEGSSDHLKLPLYPARTENHLRFPKTTSQELKDRDESIEDYFPLQKEEEIVIEPVLKVEEMPSVEDSPMLTSPVVPSIAAEAHKHSLSPTDGEPAAKKPRILPEEAARSSYKMKSVEMSNGGMTMKGLGMLPDPGLAPVTPLTSLSQPHFPTSHHDSSSSSIEVVSPTPVPVSVNETCMSVISETVEERTTNLMSPAVEANEDLPVIGSSLSKVPRSPRGRKSPRGKRRGSKGRRPSGKATKPKNVETTKQDSTPYESLPEGDPLQNLKQMSPQVIDKALEPKAKNEIIAAKSKKPKKMKGKPKQAPLEASTPVSNEKSPDKTIKEENHVPSLTIRASSGEVQLNVSEEDIQAQREAGVKEELQKINKRKKAWEKEERERIERELQIEETIDDVIRNVSESPVLEVTEDAFNSPPPEKQPPPPAEMSTPVRSPSPPKQSSPSPEINSLPPETSPAASKSKGDVYDFDDDSDEFDTPYIPEVPPSPPDSKEQTVIPTPTKASLKVKIPDQNMLVSPSSSNPMSPEWPKLTLQMGSKSEDKKSKDKKKKKKKKKEKGGKKDKEKDPDKHKDKEGKKSKDPEKKKEKELKKKEKIEKKKAKKEKKQKKAAEAAAKAAAATSGTGDTENTNIPKLTFKFGGGNPVVAPTLDVEEPISPSKLVPKLKIRPMPSVESPSQFSPQAPNTGHFKAAPVLPPSPVPRPPTPSPPSSPSPATSPRNTQNTPPRFPTPPPPSSSAKKKSTPNLSPPDPDSIPPPPPSAFGPPKTKAAMKAPPPDVTKMKSPPRGKVSSKKKTPGKTSSSKSSVSKSLTPKVVSGKTSSTKQAASKEKMSQDVTKEMKEARTVITETLGTITDEHGQVIWICPACKMPDDGSPMIGCDQCDDWYHWACVGINSAPAEEEQWYCPRCNVNKSKDGKKKKRKKR